MGIRIELTDDDLPEVAQEIEISEEEIEQTMKNPPAECREIADKILLSISSREDGVLRFALVIVGASCCTLRKKRSSSVKV